MKTPIIGLAVVLSALLQGCAGTPSRALDIYQSHTGYSMKDYPKGEFTEGQTKKKWRSSVVVGGNYDDLVHRVFGAFPKADWEPVTQSTDEERQVATRSANLMLLEATYKTLGDLGFTIGINRETMVWFVPLTVIKVTKDEVGCTASDPCTVHVQGAVAWVRPEETGTENERFISADGTSAHIVFGAGRNTDFDERIFYRTLSSHLPPKMYIYLAATSESYVQVSKDRILAYPYLLNQGQVLNFEKPTQP